MAAPKPKRGRPSHFTQALADTICTRLAGGESLRSICRDEDFPHESTVRAWVVDNYKGFSTQYARARDIGLDVMADEILDISDDGSNDWMERKGEKSDGWQLNGEHVQRSRLRVETRKWFLSKLAPKRYGDRQAVDMSGQVTFNIQLGGPADDCLEAEVVEVRGLITDEEPHG